MTDFTVEASGGGRLSVSWADGEHHLHFTALIEGDKMGPVLDKHSGQRGAGTVYKRRQEGGRGSTSYLSATDPQFAGIVEEARTMINALGLAPKAVQERADRLAETERQRVKAKAAAMREALPGRLDEAVADEVLAKAYDEIQNSCA